MCTNQSDNGDELEPASDSWVWLVPSFERPVSDSSLVQSSEENVSVRCESYEEKFSMKNGNSIFIICVCSIIGFFIGLISYLLFGQSIFIALVLYVGTSCIGFLIVQLRLPAFLLKIFRHFWGGN